MALQVTVDCADPARLVSFWAVALDYVPAPPPDGFADWRAYYLSIGEPPESLPPDGDLCDRLIDPAGVGPDVWFQVVPEPKTVKNRLHLDLKIGGGRSVPLDDRRAIVDAKVDALSALGARVIHVHDGEVPGHYAQTLADPEDNEFCVV